MKGVMNDLPAVVFPHSTLSEGSVKRMLSFFGPLTMCQPWLMDSPHFVRDYDELGVVKILSPPADLKPVAEFKTLLSEYRNWMTYNQDRGYTTFLRANRKWGTGEEATWEIRGALRQQAQQDSPAEGSDPMKWHVILHLAREIEEQQGDADSMLAALKMRRSPLKGVVEEEDAEGLFDDLPGFESEPLMDEQRLEQVIEAWFGLFGGYLRGNEFFLTWNQHVVEYVSALWEDYRREEKSHPLAVHFTWPDLSRYSPEDLIEKKARLFEDGRAKELKNMLGSLWKDPDRGLSRLTEITRDIETSCPWDYSDGKLNLDVRYFPPSSVRAHIHRGRLLNHLSGKMIVLITEASDGKGEDENRNTGGRGLDPTVCGRRTPSE